MLQVCYYCYIHKLSCSNKFYVNNSGRVHAIRESGPKLVFYVLQSEGVHLQVMANLQSYESADLFSDDLAKIKRGDIIGVKGYPTRTKTGELSIVPRKLELLSPCLHAMPHFYGLKDKVNTRICSPHLSTVFFILHTHENRCR